MYNHRFFCITLLTITLSIGLTIHTAEAEFSSLSTNSDVYYKGDYIVVFGDVETVFQDLPITLQIYHESTLIDVAQVPVATDGTFAGIFNAFGSQWKEDGTYSIRVFYTATETSEITFEFFSEMVDTSSATLPVNIPNSGTFDVGYTITGGEIQNIEMNMERYSLLIQTSMDSSGTLVLQLPRESFDAQTNDVDQSFIILISKENTNAENFTQVEYEEIATGSDFRTIRIPLESDDVWVEIIGTFVIPEFGSIVIMILVAATASAIIISKSKFSIKYN